MFLVVSVVAFQLCIRCFGEADVFSLEESCSAWSDEDAGERCSAQVSTDMLDVHGRRLMQMESFVTRLARQEADSESKPVHQAAPGSHGRSKHAAQGSSETSGLDGGSPDAKKKKSHNVLSRKSSSSDTASKERIAHKESGDSKVRSGSRHSGTTTESKAEQYHLMALRHASPPGAGSATAPLHSGKPAHSLTEAQKSSSHGEMPSHQDRSSSKEHAGHSRAGGGNAEKEHDSSDDKKPRRKSKASDSEEDDEEDEDEEDEDDEDEDDEDSGTHLGARVQKASHNRKEKTSASLLNPAIATVMFLMSAPAGMLLVAFGSLLWAKSHGDATMGGG